MKGLLLHKGLNSGKGFGVRLGAKVNPTPDYSQMGVITNKIETKYIVTKSGKYITKKVI